MCVELVPSGCICEHPGGSGVTAPGVHGGVGEFAHSHKVEVATCVHLAIPQANALLHSLWDSMSQNLCPGIRASLLQRMDLAAWG